MSFCLNIPFKVFVHTGSSKSFSFMRNFFLKSRNTCIVDMSLDVKKLVERIRKFSFQVANHASFGGYLNFPASYKNSLVLVALWQAVFNERLVFNLSYSPVRATLPKNGVKLELINCNVCGRSLAMFSACGYDLFKVFALWKYGYLENLSLSISQEEDHICSE